MASEVFASGVRAPISWAKEAGWEHYTPPERRQNIRCQDSDDIKQPGQRWGVWWRLLREQLLRACSPHPLCWTVSHGSDAFFGRCLCSEYAPSGSDFTELLPAGSVMQLTTQDESVCLQPLREGHHKLMPLRHKHKGRGTRISYAKDSSTFMEIKGLWRKVCMCNMDDFF